MPLTARRVQYAIFYHRYYEISSLSPLRAAAGYAATLAAIAYIRHAAAATRQHADADATRGYASGACHCRQLP